MARSLHRNIALRENGWIAGDKERLTDFVDDYNIDCLCDIDRCHDLFWIASVSDNDGASDSTGTYSDDDILEIRAKIDVHLCAEYADGKCGVRCGKIHLCRQFLMSYKFCQGRCFFGLSHDILDPHNWSVLLRCKELKHFNKTQLRNSRMVMNLVRASFPRLCEGFRKSGFCRKTFCGYLHICPDVIHGECTGRCISWNGRRYGKSYYHDWSSEHNKRVLNIFNLSHRKEDRDELIQNLMFKDEGQSQHQRGNDESKIPSYWPRCSSAGQLIRVPANKFYFLKKQFLQAMGDRRVYVKTIQEVCNAEFFEKYQAKKKIMEKKLGGRMKEMSLFHGTEHGVVDSICAHNFDWRLCGKNATVYGQGSYFSSFASYSHKYTTMDGGSTRYMFLADVLVGRYTKGSPNLKRPPPITKNNLELYDSCVDDVKDPSLFVVFERDQCYPKYLISYTDDEETQRGSSLPIRSSSGSWDQLQTLVKKLDAILSMSGY